MKMPLISIAIRWAVVRLSDTFTRTSCQHRAILSPPERIARQRCDTSLCMCGRTAGAPFLLRSLAWCLTSEADGLEAGFWIDSAHLNWLEAGI